MTSDYSHINPIINVPVNCRWCGEPMTVVGINCHGMSLVGLVDYEYIHTNTNAKYCYTKHKAQPYDGWAATRKVKDAMRERDEREDEE